MVGEVCVDINGDDTLHLACDIDIVAIALHIAECVAVNYPVGRYLFGDFQLLEVDDEDADGGGEVSLIL